MRILLIDFMDVLTPGGINTVVREIATHLAKKGHEVYVFTQSVIRKNLSLKYGKLTIIKGEKYINMPYGFNILNLIFLVKTIKLIRPHIIHIHGYQNPFPLFATLLIRIVSKKTPIVLSPHFSIFGHSTFIGKYFFRLYNVSLGKILLNSANALILSSLFELKTLINEVGGSIRPIMYLIPHGVSYHGHECYSDTNIVDEIEQREEVRMIYVGYLYEYKGVQYIIKALAELVNKYNIKAKLIVVGDGPYKKQLLKLATDLGTTEYIEWVGFQRKKLLNNLLCSADLLVFPSEGEMFGLVAYESLKLGLPVIVKKKAALIECSAKFKCCYGILSHEDIVKTVLKLMSKDYKQICKEDSHRITTWEQTAEEYERLFYTHTRQWV
ncbi:MAG: glycosyltransferase family 4 protein [Desulfurococcaceae archaeon]